MVHGLGPPTARFILLFGKPIAAGFGDALGSACAEPPFRAPRRRRRTMLDGHRCEHAHDVDDVHRLPPRNVRSRVARMLVCDLISLVECKNPYQLRNRHGPVP